MENEVIFFYSLFGDRVDDKYIDELSNQLPENLRINLRPQSKGLVKKRSLLGNLLLKKMLIFLDYPMDILRGLKVNDYGKPYIERFYSFNISHSGFIVACALALNARIGIDIEKLRSISLKDVEKTMNDLQWKRILSSRSPNQEFFRIWTMKEASIKADGKGLSFPLKDILINDAKATINAESWYLTEIDFLPEYCGFIATDIPISRITILKFCFE